MTAVLIAGVVWAVGPLAVWIVVVERRRARSRHAAHRWPS